MFLPNRVRVLAAVGVVGISLLAGCGSSSKSSSSSGDSTATTAAAAGDKTAFCADNAKLDKALNGASSPQELLPLVKANISTIDQFGKDAPADIKADATILVNASHAAVDKNDGAPFAEAPVMQAGDKINTYCGGGDATTTTTAKP